MGWYLGITTTRMIRPWPGADKTRGEWAVQQQLERLGIEAHAPEKITFRRSGKNRLAEPRHDVCLPGYVFMAVPDRRYFRLVEVDGLGMVMPIHGWEVMHHVKPFIKEAEEKAAEARDIIARNDRVRMAEYSPGAALVVCSGPLEGQEVKFRRVVEGASAPHPEIEAEMEIFGAVTRVKLDPLDVKKAG